MSNISQCPCGVIPPHILRRIAGAADPDSSSTARETLQEMQLLAQQRERFLINQDPYEQGPVVAKQRNVYDAQHHRTLPGKRVRSESDPRSTDVEVNEAFDGSGVTIDFYKDIFDRDSIDGSGMPVNSTVHYGKNFDNAMWNGSQMVYGDGDGKLFNRFTPAIDVIGHELTHGVTQFTAMLEYSGQTGALNEHISDAFGIMVKQYALGLTARQSNWLIGEGLFAAGVKGKALRSMAAPGTAYDDPRLGRDPQPARMHDYVVTEEDGGGVHINSGIPNHAFYLAAVAIGGNTWDVLGKVWYAALTEKTEPDARFRDFADATVVAAGELYGIAGTVQKAIAAAWAKVGLAVRSRFAAAPKWRRRPAVSRSQASDRTKGEAS